MSITWRSEIEADEPFIRRLMLEVLEAEFPVTDGWPPEHRQMLLNIQYRVRREGFSRTGHANLGIIILYQGSPAGWCVLAESDEEIRLVNLIVTSQCRGNGVGTCILRRVVGWAEACGKPARLSVAMTNHRAAALYARSGFKTSGDDGVHYTMEYAAEYAGEYTGQPTGQPTGASRCAGDLLASLVGGPSSGA